MNSFQTQIIEGHDIVSALDRLVGRRYRNIKDIKKALRKALKGVCQNIRLHFNYISWDWDFWDIRGMMFTVRCDGRTYFVDMCYAVKFLERYPPRWFDGVTVFEDEALKLYKEKCKEEMAYVYVKGIILDDVAFYVNICERCGDLRNCSTIPVEIKIEKVFILEVGDDEYSIGPIEFCCGDISEDFIFEPDEPDIAIHGNNSK
jgi:hypothetical protein